MKVVVNKLDALKRELKFEVPKERVNAKIEEVYKDITKHAKIRGFRPGHAPRHVVEAEYSAVAREEMVKKLIPEVYQEGVEKEQIDPLDLPDITDVEFKDGAMLFTAAVEIRPEVKIKNYKGITVKRKKAQVTEEEINKTLDYFKASRGQEKETPIDDSFARGLGYPDLESFKQTLIRQMEMEKDRQIRADVEQQIVEALIKDAKLTVPQSMVKRQLEYRMAEAKKHFQERRIPEAEIKKREDELRAEMQKTVEKDVKVYLILDAIRAEEKMEVAEGEGMTAKVMAFLLKEADWKDEA